MPAEDLVEVLGGDAEVHGEGRLRDVPGGEAVADLSPQATEPGGVSRRVSHHSPFAYRSAIS
jgi:hypothetical protein